MCGHYLKNNLENKLKKLSKKIKTKEFFTLLFFIKIIINISKYFNRKMINEK